MPRCQRDAAASGEGEGAPREPVGQLGEAGREQPEAGSERARGAQSPRAWPARGTTGGAPQEGPRSSAGCRTKSCRRCNVPATAVSARAPADLGGTPLPGTALGRPRGPGCAPRRAAAGKVGKWNCKGAERRFPLLSSKFLTAASSLVPPPRKPQRRGRRPGCGLGVSGEEPA